MMNRWTLRSKNDLRGALLFYTHPSPWVLLLLRQLWSIRLVTGAPFQNIELFIGLGWCILAIPRMVDASIAASSWTEVYGSLNQILPKPIDCTRRPDDMNGSSCRKSCFCLIGGVYEHQSLVDAGSSQDLCVHEQRLSLHCCMNGHTI